MSGNGTLESGHVPKVVVILLNWNGWTDTIECLESVFESDYPARDVIIVDNASEDDSLDRIATWCRTMTRDGSNATFQDLRVEDVTGALDSIESDPGMAETGEPRKNQLVLIRNSSNAGFAAGNNIGIRWALGQICEYVLLLNNDTVVAPDALTHMVVANQSLKKTGMTGARIFYADKPGKIWYSGGYLKSFLPGSRLPHFNEVVQTGSRDPENVTFITGAAILIPRQVIETCGVLDEDFFLGGEDYEFSHRVRKAGFNLNYSPAAHIWHKVSRSRKPSWYNLYSGYKAQTLFMRKRYSAMLFWPWFIAYGSLITIKLLVGSLRSGAMDENKKTRAIHRGLLHGALGRPTTWNDLHDGPFIG